MEVREACIGTENKYIILMCEIHKHPSFIYQAHHQQLLRARKVSWNKDNLKNTSSLTHEKKALLVKNIRTLFHPDALKTILKQKFNFYMETIRTYHSKNNKKSAFLNFQKVIGETCHSLTRFRLVLALVYNFASTFAHS